MKSNYPAKSLYKLGTYLTRVFRMKKDPYMYPQLAYYYANRLKILSKLKDGRRYRDSH